MLPELVLPELVPEPLPELLPEALLKVVPLPESAVTVKDAAIVAKNSVPKNRANRINHTNLSGKDL